MAIEVTTVPELIESVVKEQLPDAKMTFLDDPAHRDSHSVKLTYDTPKGERNRLFSIEHSIGLEHEHLIRTRLASMITAAKAEIKG